MGVQTVLLKQLVDGIDGGIHVAYFSHQRGRVGFDAGEVVRVGVQYLDQLADVGILIHDVVVANTRHQRIKVGLPDGWVTHFLGIKH